MHMFFFFIVYLMRVWPLLLFQRTLHWIPLRRRPLTTASGDPPIPFSIVTSKNRSPSPTLTHSVPLAARRTGKFYLHCGFVSVYILGGSVFSPQPFWLKAIAIVVTVRLTARLSVDPFIPCLWTHSGLPRRFTIIQRSQW